MNKASRLTAAQRNRALSRLRTFTVGTALASAAATGAFGYLAVMTKPGTQVTDTTTTTAQSGQTSDTTTTTTDGSTTSTATTSPTMTTGLQNSTSGTTTTRHRAHATTGGS